MPHKHLTIPSNTAQLKGVRDAVLELAGPCLFERAHMLVLAVDEALANVILHGAAQAGSAEAIDVDILAEGGRIEVRIAGRGPEFDPSRAADIDPAARVRQRLRGGMGNGIIRRVVDEIHYARLPGALNELRLIKYCEALPKPHANSGPNSSENSKEGT